MISLSVSPSIEKPIQACTKRGSTISRNQALDCLMQAKHLRCNFGPGAVADWETSEARIELDQLDASLIIDSIDIRGQKARIIGKERPSEAIVLATPAGLTFIEQIVSGDLVFITVFPEYAEGREAFVAVMSRHMSLWGRPLLSQYHGTCEIWMSGEI